MLLVQPVSPANGPLVSVAHWVSAPNVPRFTGVPGEVGDAVERQDAAAGSLKSPPTWP